MKSRKTIWGRSLPQNSRPEQGAGFLTSLLMPPRQHKKTKK
jgi:hypothetical protein